MRKQPQPKPEGVTKPKPPNIRPVPPSPLQLKGGGSAFPRHALVMDEAGVMHVATVDGSGMSLRDYFAAAVLTGKLLYQQWSHSAPMVTVDAYETADAMLEARKG